MPDNDKKKFGVFKALAAVIVLLAAAIIALPFVIDANSFRPELEAKLGDVLDREVRVGKLKLSLLSGSVAVDDISVSDDPAFSRSPFISAGSFQLGVELKPLIFSRTIRITDVLLDNPAITLIRSSSGKWNFSSLCSHPADKEGEIPGRPPAGLPGTDISINQLKITRGTVIVIQGERRRKPISFGNVDIRAKGLSFGSSFPFTLMASLPGGGNLTVEGNAGPVHKADLALTPFTAKLAVRRMDIVGSGLLASNSGLAGIIDFDGTISSNGREMQSQGLARAEKLQFIKGGSPAGKPISLSYAIAYDPSQQSGMIRDARLEYGKAAARLNGNYRMLGDSLSLKIRMHGTDMPVQDIKSLLPAFAITLPKGASLEGGVVNADFAVEGPIEKMATAGSANISKTRLVGFDLTGKMAMIAALAGVKSNTVTEIEEFACNIRMSPAGIQVSSLRLTAPALGELSGSGIVGSDQSLDFKMLASLRPSGGLGLSLVRLIKGKGDTLSIPFFVRGTASEPEFIADAKKAADSLLESALSKQDARREQTGARKLLGDALRELLQKKKQ